MVSKRTTKKTTAPKRTSPPTASKSATRSTTPRKRAVTKSTVSKTTPVTTVPKNRLTPFTASPVKFRRSSVITGVIVVAVILLLYIFRSVFVVATVNGQPISRLQLYQELEKQGGKQALSGIITETLITQEAAKEHVTVSDQEVNDQIKSIEQNLAKQGQKLDQVLTAQGMTQKQLTDQIKLQKLAEKMAAKNITVSDKEISDYIEQNKDNLPQGQDEKTLRASVSDRLKQQKVNDKIQSWLQNLQKNAKINYLVNY